MPIDFNDLGALALDQNYDDTTVVKQLRVTVKKPSKADFVRVHPKPLIPGKLGLYDDRDEGFYLVPPAMMCEMEGLAFEAMLRLAVTLDGRYLIWPLRLAGPDGRINPWHESAICAANQAVDKWLCPRANMRGGYYDVILAENQRRPEPEWPTESFAKIVELGFKDHVIDALDHPVLKRLRGE
jgi:hypothetical protein